MVLHHQNFRIFDLSLDVNLNIYTDCRLCFLRDFIMNNFYRAVNPIKKDFLFHKPLLHLIAHVLSDLYYCFRLVIVYIHVFTNMKTVRTRRGVESKHGTR